MSDSERQPLVDHAAVDEANIERGVDGCFIPKSSFKDHFSLQSPSDVVRFRNTAVRVYENGTEQFQLEETPTHIKAKKASDATAGLAVIRAAYTLVAVLMTGFLFIFCLQLMLFLFMSLVMDGGLTSKQDLHLGQLFGTILSIPLFLYGLGSALTMASEFIADTWNGHYFFRTIMRWNSIYIEWGAFAIFLGIPFITFVYNLAAGNDAWWEATALTWFRCIFVGYCIFCLVVFIFEIRGALELLNHHPGYEDNVPLYKLIGRAVVIRQYHRFSGVRHRTFLIEGGRELPSANDSYDKSESVDHEFLKERISWYSRLTQWAPDYLWYEYDEPPRQYSVQDVLDQTPFVTSSTWNLEKLYCRRTDVRSVIVVNGASALTDEQVASTMVCAILGNVFALMVLASLLIWADMSAGVVFFICVIFIISLIPALRQTYALYDTYRDTRERRRQGSNASEALYQVTETFRITKPTRKFAWILCAAEIILVFVWPLISLMRVGNTAIAMLFFVLGFFSLLRHYFNAPVVLSELGSLELLDGDFIRSTRKDRDSSPEAALEREHDDWRDKNRMSSIVGKISQGGRRDTWSRILGGCITLIFLLFVSAYNQGSDAGRTDRIPRLLSDFKYTASPDSLSYPTCSMRSGFEIPGSQSSALVDYAYLAVVAYIAPENTHLWLDGWFGEGIAEDNTDIVKEYRDQAEDADSAVQYKLIEFPSLDPDFAVMSIRGTANGWDMLTDAQLWSAAALAQMVRGLLPAGEVWNAILENLVLFIGVLQDESLKKVAFYRQTAGFVDWLRNEKQQYEKFRITGHSLGGGLAMITGAQTKTPAIGLSGPNSMISRDTYHPKVSVEDLNTHTFNIVPNRDVVAMIDDLAQNYQRIQCRAPANNPFDCHKAVRSVCEILYTCGSGPRPVLCDCAKFFGYPEPEPTGNRTFAEACPYDIPS